MLGGWCVRDTSLLCTVHPLSFKHSDHCVRVDPSTSPYHCPALAPVWRVTCFFFGGPACLRFLSAAGSLWEALWASCDIRIVHQKVAKDALNLVFTGAVAVLWPIPSHSKKKWATKNILICMLHCVERYWVRYCSVWVHCMWVYETPVTRTVCPWHVQEQLLHGVMCESEEGSIFRENLHCQFSISRRVTFQGNWLYISYWQKTTKH